MCARPHAMRQQEMPIQHLTMQLQDLPAQQGAVHQQALRILQMAAIKRNYESMTNGRDSSIPNKRNN